MNKLSEIKVGRFLYYVPSENLKDNSYFMNERLKTLHDRKKAELIICIWQQ